jgi:hypothetical protein
VELGVLVHVRDVETLDDVAELTAPHPVESNDVVASVDDVYVVEVVLLAPPGSRCVPVLANALPAPCAP